MKKSKNDIVAFPAFPAQVEAKPTRMKSSDQDQAVDGATVEVEDLRDAISGADPDALTELVEQVPTPDDVVEICRKNDMDERGTFGYLETKVTGPMARIYYERYIMSIPASEVLEDGPIEGIDEDLVREFFAYMCGSYYPYAYGYIDIDEYEWLRLTIKPSWIAGVSEVMRRLTRIMRAVVGELYGVDMRHQDDPSSPFMTATPDQVIDALIDSEDPDDLGEDGPGRICVYLETKDGQYEPVACKMIKAEAERFAVKPEDLRDPGQPQDGGLHNNMSFQAPEDDVIVGIARAFDRWIVGASDLVLTYIINHHELPAGVGKLHWVGDGASAKRFWIHVGMKPHQFNQCFIATRDGKQIKFKSNSGNPCQIDYDAERGVLHGIYVPLSLIQRKAK